MPTEKVKRPKTKFDPRVLSLILVVKSFANSSKTTRCIVRIRRKWFSDLFFFYQNELEKV